MTKKRNPFEDRPWVSINVKMPNLPATTTILALGFLTGNLMFLPMIAWLGEFIRAEYRDTVETIAGLFKDGMLLILGFYFAKVVNAGQQDMANRALDAAVNSPAPNQTGAAPTEEFKP